MQTKFIEPNKKVPLSELPAGSAFMLVLKNDDDIFMVLNASYFTGYINHEEFKDHKFADLIFYCRLDSGLLDCVKKNDAKEIYVYPVQPVSGDWSFRV